MQKYYNAFISSTSQDLKAHRRAVIDILPADEVHPINMEGFNASRDNALQVCYDELGRADIFIGFYAYRYGFAPGPEMTYTDQNGNVRAGDGVTSITEWEYRWAVERGIPLLLYVAETGSWNSAYKDDDLTAITRFKKEISGKHVRGSFGDNPDSLAKLVSRDINKVLRDLMKPSPQQAKEQEEHALIVARTQQQTQARQPKSTARFIGILPRSFRRDNRPFHDRVYEQEKIRGAIINRERLITVYGRGGVGKTGLACYVIEELEHTAGVVDGMVYRSLETGSVTISEIVADFGRIIPLDIPPNTPPAEQITALLQALRDGHYVLFLDNFETAQNAESHAIDEPSLRLLIETVLARGGLTVLITTRYPFPLDDFTLAAYQTLVPLEEGLPLKDAREFMRSLRGAEYLPEDERRLDDFIQRVRSFPRALEAAMGWLNAGKGRRQLDDLLADNIAIEQITAYVVGRAIDALSISLRQVLEALAICREPAPSDLLEYLLAPFRDQTDFPLRDALERLLDAHFIVMSGERYSLHPLDREHCLTNLPDEDETGAYSKAALNCRAVEYYRHRRKPQSEWRTLDDLTPQLMEFEHHIALGDYDAAAAILTEIDFGYLLLWGYAELVRDYHLSLQGKIRSKTLRQASAGRLGSAYRNLGEVQTAIGCYEQALTIARDIEDRRGEGNHLGNLGSAHHALGEVQTAIGCYEQALAIARDIEDRRGEGNRLGNLGAVYRALGEVQTAIGCYEQALTIARDIGDRRGEGIRLGNLGAVYRALGEVQTAIGYYEQALTIARDIGDRRGEGHRLGNLGLTKVISGNVIEGIRDLQTSITILSETKHMRYLQYKLTYLTEAHILNGDDHAASETITRARTYDVPHNNHVALALAGVVHLRSGDFETAQGAFEASITAAHALLAKTPGLYDALYVRGLARAGLALISGESLDAAADDYRAALALCAAAGVKGDALRRLNYLRGVDPDGRLEPLRALLE